MKQGALRRRALVREVYLLTVGLTGVALLAVYAPRTIQEADLGFLVYIAVGMLVEWAHVPLARGTMTLSFAVVLPAFVLYGPGGASLVQIVGYLVGNAFFDPRGWRVKLFNCGQHALTVFAAAGAFRLVGGVRMMQLDLGTFLALGVFTVVYFAVNHAFVGLWFTLGNPEESLMVIWGEPAKWEGITYLISAPLGMTVIGLHSLYGIGGAGAIFLASLVAALVFRLAFRLDRLNRELRILYESAQDLGQGLELDGVKEHIFDNLERLAPFALAVLFLWDEVGQVLRAVDGRPADNPFAGQCFRLGEALVGEAAERRVVEVVEINPADLHLAADGAGQRPLSVVVAPLVAEEALVGVLVLGSGYPERYSEEHVRLLTIFASQAGAALNRALRYQETRQMAITDSKTGVYNYRFFYERLIDEIRRHEAKAKSFSLIFVDVDHLKEVNDRYGHQIGDEVLRQVATLVKDNVRGTDEVARYGGEEFVVLLPGAPGDESLIVAERIRRGVETHKFVTAQGLSPARVTVTAGVATYPEHATQPDELIFRADEAMYSGKHRGRNRVCLYASANGLSETGPA